MNNNNPKEEKYFAFISYSTKDTAEAKRLHHKLEYFKVTSSQASQKGWKRKPLDPTFFAPYEIQPNGLSDELKLRLRNSNNLIVVCSPNSAQSDWVQWEIEEFIELGRKDHIYAFIINGAPNSNDPTTECYGYAIKKKGNGLSDILGANIHEKIFKLPYLNRERAYIQLITKLLGIEFDSVWKRHKRQLMVRLFSAILLFICVVFSILSAMYLSSSFDGKIHFKKDSTPMLYEGDGTLKIILDNDTIIQKVENTKLPCIIKNIPGKYRFKKARCQFNMFGYQEEDTIIQLSNKGVSINIQRLPETYGHIEGKIVKKDLSLTPIEGAKVSIKHISTTSNHDGCFSIDIPIDLQNSDYYEAVVQHNNIGKKTKLYPMRHNPNIINLIIFE